LEDNYHIVFFLSFLAGHYIETEYGIAYRCIFGREYSAEVLAEKSLSFGSYGMHAQHVFSGIKKKPVK
jgi:hypothetical protein